jgi:hypothetical protein
MPPRRAVSAGGRLADCAAEGLCRMGQQRPQDLDGGNEVGRYGALASDLLLL